MAMTVAESRMVGLAGEMPEAVERTGKWVHMKMPHGLELVMQRKEGRWRLAMGREMVYPSDAEVEVCRDAFAVPAGAEQERLMRMRKHAKTGRTITYYVVEVTWREAGK